MVSRENKVILLFATTALVLGYGGLLVTNMSDVVFGGIILFVGVVAPLMVNNYLDDRDSE